MPEPEIRLSLYTRLLRLRDGDAIELDTTDRTVEDVVGQIVALVRGARGAREVAAPGG